MLSRLPSSLILIGLICVAYANSFSGQFVFDDLNTIVFNPHIQTLHPWWGIFERSAEADLTCWGRPVVAISLAFNYALGKLSVGGYHAFNLAIHLLNALVLWRLGVRLLGSPAVGFADRKAEQLGWVVALLWGLHPLGTSTTTYIVQRAESLMALAYLGSLYSAVRFYTSPGRPVWGVTSILCCAVGMATKETMVTAPLAILLLGCFFFRASCPIAMKNHPWWPLGLVASWGILAAVMMHWPRTVTVGAGVQGMGTVEYFLIQLQVIPHYCWQVICPIDLNIAYPQRLWHSRLAIPPHTWPLLRSDLDAWPGALIMLSMITATILLLLRRPPAGAALVLAGLILAPTSSLIPIPTSLAADHRMYLPSAALIALLVVLGQYVAHRLAFLRPWLLAPLAPAMVGLIAALLLVTTMQRNRDYQNPEVLWHRTLDHYPHDALGWNELGFVFWLKHELSQAREAYARSASLCPDYLTAQVNRAVCDWNLGQDEQSLAELKAVLERDPNNSSALHNLAEFATQSGDFPLASRCLRQILERNPDDDAALEQLSKLER